MDLRVLTEEIITGGIDKSIEMGIDMQLVVRESEQDADGQAAQCVGRERPKRKRDAGLLVDPGGKQKTADGAESTTEGDHAKFAKHLGYLANFSLESKIDRAASRFRLGRSRRALRRAQGLWS